MLDEKIKNIEKYCGGGLFLIIIVLCFAEVMYRFVFRKSAGWIEEYEIFIFIWFVYLGSAACVAEDKHVCVEMIYNRFSPSVKLVVDFIRIILWLVVCVIVAKENLVVIALNFSRNAKTVMGGLPYWIGQSAVFVGMCLMVVHLLFRIPAAINAYKKAVAPTNPGGGEQ